MGRTVATRAPSPATGATAPAAGSGLTSTAALSPAGGQWIRMSIAEDLSGCIASPRSGPHGDVDREDDDQQEQRRRPRLLVQGGERLAGVVVDDERQGVHWLLEVADVDEPAAERGEQQRRGLAERSGNGQHHAGED